MEYIYLFNLHRFTSDMFRYYSYLYVNLIDVYCYNVRTKMYTN